MKTLIISLWMLPQNLVGVCVFLFTKLQKSKSVIYNGTIVTEWAYCSCASIGQFIFLRKHVNETTAKHEFGHYKQGLILGWLWSIIIGIPSILWCGFFSIYGCKHNVNYYKFYTESWADKLAGVKR